MFTDYVTGGGSPSLVVPLVEGNGCRKIKVAVLLQRAIPPFCSSRSCLGCMGGPVDAVPPALPLGGDSRGVLALLAEYKN